MHFSILITILCNLILTSNSYAKIKTSQRRIKTSYPSLTIVSSANISVECLNPVNATIYKPEYNYCIYGIKYYHNEIGFGNVLYFNDPDYPWGEQDITYKEFGKVAQPLCANLDVSAKENAQYKNLYYAAWVMTTNNTYDDIFLLCCKLCPVAKTEAQWRIILKLQFLIRRQYSLIRNYILNEVLNYNNATQFYIDESYYITNRIREVNTPMKVCNAENFKKVPITTNNNVCFVTASDIFDQSSLYNRQFEQTRYRLAHEIIRLGPYSTANMGYMKDLQCRMQNTSHEDNECIVWMTYDEYGYECCCYGDLIGNCQDRISNSILVGTEQLTAYNEFMTCAIFNHSNTRYTYKYDKKTKKVTLQGKMEHILNGMRTKSYCPFYLEISNTGYKYYLLTDKFRTGKPGYSIFTDGVAAGCHYYANWDIRLMDIVKTRCIQLKPLMDMCLMNVPLATDHFEALCCCNYQTFCNYNGLILDKLNAKTVFYYCKYNPQYQFLFNDLILINKPPSRSCLLHYIDNTTLLDMDFRLPNNDFVLFQQPGSAFYPIDFSYALLEDGKCHYVEVEVNLNYTNLQSCREKIMLETNYMPLKIFACRCRTEVNSKTPCDEKLATEIISIARSWPLENLTQCMQYNQQKLQNVPYQMQRIFLTYTSYCYTEMILKKNESEIEFYVSGGGVTHVIAKNARKHLNHIAYAMWIEAGSTSSLCSTSQKGKAYCFCRSYDNYADACNEYSWHRIKLQRILITQELHFTIRKEYLNTLSDHLVQKGEIWCHSPDIYATLDIDMENADVITSGKCAHSKSNIWEFNDDRIFCVELKALENECVAKVTDTEYLEKNHLLCCCKNKCEAVGFTIQTLAKNILDHLDTY
ncbi:Chorismate synthase [Dirofilaria immitis]